MPWSINAIPAVLVDVAGIREGDFIHPVEAIGIERAKKELARADLILHLVDTNDEDLSELSLNEHIAPILLVGTKRDLLLGDFPSFPCLISAKTGDGLAELKTQVKKHLTQDLPDSSEVLLTRLRHVDLVNQTSHALALAIDTFEKGLADECVAYELRDAGRWLDELLGKSLNEEVLDLIFSRFCIGK